MKVFRLSYNLVFASVLGLSIGLPAQAANSFDRSPEVISQSCDTYMAKFEGQIEQLVSDGSNATYETVFVTFDDFMTEFVDALLHDYLMQNVHTDEAVRQASTDCALKGFAALNALNANRPLYERMSAVSTQGLSADKAFTVNYWKQNFESSGIGKSQSVREQIQLVNDKISQVGNTFRQNITKAVNSIKVKPERLAGLPQDYLDSHPVNEQGLVTITTAYSDTTPIAKYAHDASLRKEVSIMTRNRG
ncbi:hypothetical protein RS130_08305 [Paraglaciecola aquimarina]|uniref:Uncharacterized protein n=1 Tax=Paraglaciecola aquimarina TaxID=1235557 RepID=A0ABU3SVA9_9ALTE|nr:hypothetical protein [Paraglaciecola aquimarina]MDU0353930.1 hypothetical protein [Paraglaciecola aquimarina]